jgi:hypothetical protein
MSYCTYAEVVAGTGTTLAQATVESLITYADAMIDSWLDEWDVTGSASSRLKVACILLTQAFLMRRRRLDGTQPNSLTIGEMSSSDNNDRAILDLEDRAKSIVDIYIRKTLGLPYKETDATIDKMVVRADHAMSAFKLDQNTVPEYHDQAADYGVSDPNYDL